MKFKLFDHVALLRDRPERGLNAGAVGTVVETYPKTSGLEVEFMREDGSTIAVLTLDVEDVRAVVSSRRSTA